MNIEEFKESFDFAKSAIERKNIPLGSVRVLVKFMNRTFALEIKEIGYDDKSGTIYIEASE